MTDDHSLYDTYVWSNTREQIQGMIGLMAVSILVCTRDRREMLDALLADLRKQDYAGDVQIVVAEETDDPRSLEGVYYVPIPIRNRGIAFARNTALAHAAHEMIVFVDDDCRVDPEWLSILIAPMLEDEDVLGVQGGVTVPEDTNAIGWAETLLGFPGGGVARIHQSGGEVQETREVSTLNAAYRKSAIEKVGGFPEGARFGGEDYVLAKRVAKQGRLLFVPDALVRHVARGGLPTIWQWFVRRGMAEIGLLRGGLAPLYYKKFLLQSSIFLKFGITLLTVAWLGWAVPLLLLAGLVAATWWRLRWVLNATNIPQSGLWVAPLVRLTMDIATDAGRLRALLD